MKKIDDFLGWLLEDGVIRGLGGPPNKWASAEFSAGPRETAGRAAYAIAFHNDASEIWIGVRYRDGKQHWMGFIEAARFRKMALWYLWRWAWGEWFGLRRTLYYMYLRHSLRGRIIPAQEEEME